MAKSGTIRAAERLEEKRRFNRTVPDLAGESSRQVRRAEHRQSLKRDLSFRKGLAAKDGTKGGSAVVSRLEAHEGE